VSEPTAVYDLAPTLESPLVPVNALSGDLIQREAELATLERRAFEARDAYLRTRFELGQILIRYRELCQEQETRFLELIRRLGMSQRSCYEHIAVCHAVQANPQLRNLAEGSFQKLVAIAEGMDEQQVAEVARGDGRLTLDEIDNLSVRKLKARIRELTADQERLVKKATKALKDERDLLVKERDALAALTGDDLDSIRRSVAVLDEQTKAGIATLNGIYRQLKALDIDADDPAHKTLIQELDNVIRRLGNMGSSLWHAWFDKRLLDYGDDGL
jgi:hypothetical protein